MAIRTAGGTSQVLGAVASGADFTLNANNEVTLTYARVEAVEVARGGVEVANWNR